MNKVYLGIKFHEDYRNRDKIEAIAQALDGGGYQCICVARDIEKWGTIRFEPPELMRVTFEIIDACVAVVIDLSEKGVGLGIEAGYAHAKGIPVIVVAEAGADISDTLRGIARDVLAYDPMSDLKKFFAQTLARLPLNHTQENSS